MKSGPGKWIRRFFLAGDTSNSTPDRGRDGLSPKEKILLEEQDPGPIFSYIHEHRLWDGEESVSGPGSDLLQTTRLVERFPEVLKAYDVDSVLDIPCGDFHWMSHALPSGARYLGGDLVGELIDGNRDRFRRDGVEFRTFDLLS